jgi:pimeloyl-ACP methyl ester carboxylesterase
VLLHGVLQTGEGMRHLADQLALDREVLVPDLRGRGESDRPSDGYDPPTMADDVAGLIDRLGIEQPALIGRLHGGLIAYHLAARRPELVSGVVLGDANPEVTADRASQALDAVSLLPRAFATHADATRFYEEGLGLAPDRARHDIPSDLEATPGGGYRWRHDLDIVRHIETAAIPRSDWDVLAQVRCPALILRGQRGEIRQETAERMLAVMPQARAQTIYGASHDVFLGPGSEQTLAAIQLFLFGLDGRER